MLSHSLLQRAIERAFDFNLTCYDATYSALAEDLEFPFIAADEKLLSQGTKIKSEAGSYSIAKTNEI